MPVWLFSLLVALVVAAVATKLLFFTYVKWPYLAELCIQNGTGQQFYHDLVVRASTQYEAQHEALKRGARRFPGCGIQVVRVTRH